MAVRIDPKFIDITSPMISQKLLEADHDPFRQ
jgi:hypothetical protein